MEHRADTHQAWRSLPQRSLVTVAGLLGAGGVGLGAAGAHLGGGDLARLASLFLLIHAGAIAGLVALAVVRPVAASWTCGAAWVLAVGCSAFSGDLAGVAFTGRHLLPGLAPGGGSLLIGGWLLAALSPWARGR